TRGARAAGSRQRPSMATGGPMTYTNVVVGSDGSATALLAVQGAAEIAAEHGARLVLVTAYKPHGDELAGQSNVPDEVRWALTDRAQAEERVAHGRDLATKAGVQRTVTRAVAGSPVDVLLEAAESFGADLIVVGSKGLTDGSHGVLGSVAASVAHHAPCDVMIVHTSG
ncbi:MAG: universal stress protein, partial [Acidimicrobiales bacterium]